MNQGKSSARPRAQLIKLVFCCAALSAALAFGCAAQEQTRWNAAQFRQAGRYLESGNCSATWNAIWPLAKRGDRDAQLFLYSAMICRLYPPGRHSSLSRHNHAQHMLTLAAHGALAAPEYSTRKTIHDAVRWGIPALIDQLKLGAEGSRASHCYRSGDSFEKCLASAISLGVVQTFDDYARDVDAVARESDSEASCFYPH